MEIPGKDNRPANGTVLLSRTELEALVDHHRSLAKVAIEHGNHRLVTERMARIEHLQTLMPRQPSFD
jgi:hypothetical protein